MKRDPDDVDDNTRPSQFVADIIFTRLVIDLKKEEQICRIRVFDGMCMCSGGDFV